MCLLELWFPQCARPGVGLLGHMGFPGGPDSKESACNAGDLGSIPVLERSLGEGNGNPFQYPGLKNSMETGNLEGYSPWGCKEADIIEQLSLTSVITQSHFPPELTNLT